MVTILIAPGQTVDTTDPHVTVTIAPGLPADGASYKMVLVVEDGDGNQSAPAEIELGQIGPLPA
jgi:hypothetical protein